jgi:hypothetical protein
MKFRGWIILLFFIFTAFNLIITYFCSTAGHYQNEFLKWEFSAVISLCVLVIGYGIMNKLTNMSEKDIRRGSAIFAILVYTSVFPPYIKHEEMRLYSTAFWSVVLLLQIVYLKLKAKKLA